MIEQINKIRIDLNGDKEIYEKKFKKDCLNGIIFDIDFEQLRKIMYKEKLSEFVSYFLKIDYDIKFLNPIPLCLVKRSLKNKSKCDFPKNCEDCGLLYDKDFKENVISCQFLNIKGPNINYMKTREEIFEFINHIRLERKMNNICEKCIYFIRGKCDGLCFRS
jgi:hypothetical protein